MSKKYWVSIREVHIQAYGVMADSPAEAKIVVKQKLEAGTPFEPEDRGEFEFSHHMEPVTWTVETD